MPKQQTITRTAGGLQTNPNAVNETGEGAFLEADNCICDRPGIVSKRRGFARFGSTISARQLFDFQDRLLVRDSATLYYDADGNGTWTAYTGSFSPPSGRMRSLEAQGTFYLTTSQGIVRTDSLTVAPTTAGIPTGLDTQLTKVGTGASWFEPNSQVGYRILWGRVDRNDRLLIGAPSFRETIFNSVTAALAWSRTTTTATITHASHGFVNGDTVEISASSDTAAVPNGSYVIANVSAGAYDITVPNAGAASGTISDGKNYSVRVEFTIPDDVRSGDFFDIYRTEISAADTVDPGDRQKRVIRYPVTNSTAALSHSAGTVTVTQATHGYASGDVVRIEGASNSSFDGKYIITVTGGDTYTYTQTATASSATALALRLKVAVTDDWDLPLGEDLYTNVEREGILKANARPPMAEDMASYKGHVFYANTKKEHYLPLQLIEIANLVDDTSSITITQGSTARTYTFSASEALSTRKFKRWTTELTTAQNIEKTMKSFQKIVNRDPGSIWYVYYISGIEDAPGEVVIESRTLNTEAFHVTCNDATTSVKFSPNLPTSGASFESDNQTGPNRLYRSKVEEPESVPDLDFDFIGDDSNAILRIFALRDSLMIVTEEGIYRLSGDTDQTFTIKPLDPTVAARAPDSWVATENAVWGLSTDGILRATEAGTQLVSWPINDQISKILTFPGAETLTHAVAYQSDHKYILFAQRNLQDATTSVAWVYNTLTKKWTRWIKSVVAGLVPRFNDRLFLAHAVDSYVLKERKELTLGDYADEEIAAEATAVGTTTDDDGNTVSTVEVTFSYSQAPEPGWLWRKDPSNLPASKVIAVEPSVSGSLYTLTLEDHFPGLIAGSGKLYLPIVSRIRWAPETAKNASSMKHFSTVHIYFEAGNSEHSKVGFFSDIEPTEFFLDEVRFDSSTAGVLHRENVPTQFQRCRALNLLYESRWGEECMAIAHVGYSLRLTGDTTMIRARA